MISHDTEYAEANTDYIRLYSLYCWLYCWADQARARPHLTHMRDQTPAIILLLAMGNSSSASAK